jgi:hypothetical protein
VPGTGSEYTDATLSVIRRRVVGDGFFEELTVLNHGNERIRPEITIAAGADFADLFQVKDATIDRPGKELARVDDGVLVLGYERAGYICETWIRPHDERAELRSASIVFRPTIEPHGSWSTWVEVVAAVDGTPAGHERTRYRPGEELQPHAPSGSKRAARLSSADRENACKSALRDQLGSAFAPEQLRGSVRSGNMTSGVFMASAEHRTSFCGYCPPFSCGRARLISTRRQGCRSRELVAPTVVRIGV